MLQPTHYQAESRQSVATLQQLWESGGFAWTIQLPPLAIVRLGETHQEEVATLKRYDAVLAADAPAGEVALGSLAQAILLQRAGLTALVQMSGRDKNRIALQS